MSNQKRDAAKRSPFDRGNEKIGDDRGHRFADLQPVKNSKGYF
ncbi:hypothetical protein [Nostoc sp. C052]|nr:hypothetical protein [Nostoc sp. C052]